MLEPINIETVRITATVIRTRRTMLITGLSAFFFRCHGIN